MTADVLLIFLRLAGFELSCHFPAQFSHLMQVLEADYIPLLRSTPSSAARPAPISNLEVLLRDMRVSQGRYSIQHEALGRTLTAAV
jgi:hypothetical protein